MTNDRTDHLDLPLPSIENDLEVDVQRLRTTLQILDDALELLGLELAGKAETTDLEAFLAKAGGYMTGKLALAASTALRAGLNVGAGVAPDAPINGDLWATAAGLYARLGGVTQQLALAGHTHPQSAVTGLEDALAALTAGLATKAPSAAPTLTGLINVNGSTRRTPVAMGAGTAIDCTAGNWFTKTMAGNLTLTLSNVPPANTWWIGFLELTHTSGVLTHPANTRHIENVAPSLTAGRVHTLVYMTRDGGANIRCAALKNFPS